MVLSFTGIMSLLLGLQNISELQLELTFEGLGQRGGQVSEGLQLLSGAHLSSLCIKQSDVCLDDAGALSNSSL